MTSIAFIVMTYNRSDALLAVLRGLAPQCAPGDSVVIADDGSAPSHVDAMRRGLPAFGCRVRHVWHPDVGFTLARSRNLGALHAGADYLVYLDGDCVPSPHFAAAHRALARRGMFVTGSRVLVAPRLTDDIVATRVDPWRLRAADWMRERMRGQVNKLAHLVNWPGAPGRDLRQFRWKGIKGCNLAVWADDYAAVNGSDESFTGWGHEDADLVLRLHHLGRSRRRGFLATEVLHLWHRETRRDQADDNRRRVEQRLAGGITRADIGLAEAAAATDVAVTELNANWRH